MTNPRLEQLLSTLAQRHLPAPLRRAADAPFDVQGHALALARNGVLVLPVAATAGQNSQMSAWVNEMVSLYGSFYRVLTDTLFPSLKAVQARYADDQQPPIIIMEGHALPVMEALANYVVPYVAMNQRRGAVNMAEVTGILNFVLEDLEGLDVERARYRDMMEQGKQLMMRLLAMPLQQQSLTSFARQTFLKIAPPDTPNLPPPPPEAPTQRRPAPPPPPESPAGAQKPFTSDIPIFFDLDDKDGKQRPMPPVPPLPKG
jgi:hypothetical protein